MQSNVWAGSKNLDRQKTFCKRTRHRVTSLEQLSLAEFSGE